MPPAKRPHDYIDLTGDDEVYVLEGPSNKRPALSATPTSRLNSNGGSAKAPSTKNRKPHQSSRPVANASFPSPSSPEASQAEVVEVFDLTQDDDGPERELYSTHGLFSTGILCCSHAK